jgi:hypothetical protein
MEESKLENFSDRQLIKYMKYVLPIVEPFWTGNLVSFIDEIYGPRERQIGAALGGTLSRLDKEYLFYLLTNNDGFDDETINRPTLTEREINFNVKERQIVYTTYSEDLPTYVSEYIDQSYLYHLKVTDEIDPWTWESDTDYGDTDYIDDEFDY